VDYDGLAYTVSTHNKNGWSGSSQ